MASSSRCGRGEVALSRLFLEDPGQRRLRLEEEAVLRIDAEHASVRDAQRSVGVGRDEPAGFLEQRLHVAGNEAVAGALARLADLAELLPEREQRRRQIEERVVRRPRAPSTTCRVVRAGSPCRSSFVPAYSLSRNASIVFAARSAFMSGAKSHGLVERLDALARAEARDLERAGTAVARDRPSGRECAACARGCPCVRDQFRSWYSGSRSMSGFGAIDGRLDDRAGDAEERAAASATPKPGEDRVAFACLPASASSAASAGSTSP